MRSWRRVSNRGAANGRRAGMRRWIGVVAVVGLVIAILVASPRPAFAWGPEGHRIVALLADDLLRQSDPAIRAKVLAVLATDKGNKLTKSDIASEATWADVLREKSQEAHDATSAWHSTRLGADNPSLATAC